MDPNHPQPAASSTRSWSIYGRSEITDRYEILGRIGSGAYADVYRARRRSDSIIVALKEIHDYQSSFREIEALQTLRHSPNVVDLIEFFWSEDEDAVLVLEFLPSDLAAVIDQGKRSGGIGVGEVKQWMLQILRGVDDCHRSLIVHRDLKPSNLLISQTGVLKLADFGQARILLDSGVILTDNAPREQGPEDEVWVPQQLPTLEEENMPLQDGLEDQNPNREPKPICEEDYLREVDGLEDKYPVGDTTDKEETSVLDGDMSCLATCSTGDMNEDGDPFKESSYFYEAAEVGGGDDDESGALTSCVGTRWFRAPELLYGSTNYGLQVDLWSLGCIFAELLTLQPLFPGTADLEQLAKIIAVLGDMNEETWPGCSKLPDYNKISFNKIESPVGLEACLANRSPSEVNIVRRLLCYDPAKRVTAMELLSDASFFREEPLPVPLNELMVPAKDDNQDDESSGEEWGGRYREMDSDSDLEGFGKMDVVTTEKGFSLQFS